MSDTHDDLQLSRAFAGLDDTYEGVNRSYGTNSFGRTFLDVGTNTSVRSDFYRNDYDYYRPGERVPTNPVDIMRVCMKAYDRVGIVRHVIDLMGDFASQGVRLVHSVKSVERFYQRWFEKVRGKHTSERFLNYLYRCGNVIVKRKMGRIPKKFERKMKSVKGQHEIKLEKTKVKRRVAPLEYNFLNPLTIEIIGGNLASFIGHPIYALRINYSLRGELAKLQRFTHNKKLEKILLDQLPLEIREAIEKGARLIPLEPDKVSAFHYKKDDWKPWANPMTYAVYDNLIMLEKMHLADMAALDGAISNIRLWKLGVIDTSNPHNSIIPTRAAINKLRNILANNIGGGVLDLVWGPELDFKESQTSVHNFLGPEKYQQVMAEIYEGLGIPPTLTGSSGSGFTNNFIAMQTLINRLEYGRSLLIEFWMNEIRLVQEAMGFSQPAQIIFDNMSLSDENSQHKLLLDLIDRDLVSAESVLDRMNFLSDIEKARIKQEQKERMANKLPPKAGPYHNPQTDHDLKKIILQRGGVAPSEVGLELEPKKEGEESPHEQMEKTQLKLADMKNKGQEAQKKFKPTSPGGDGRPQNSRDSQPRKKREVKPRTSADEFINMFMWANKAQAEVADMLVPAIPKVFNKSNARSLTSKEKEVFEGIKFRVLCNLTPYESIDKEKVYNILEKQKPVNLDIAAMTKTLAYTFVKQNDRQPTADELRQIQASAYAIEHTE